MHISFFTFLYDIVKICKNDAGGAERWHSDGLFAIGRFTGQELDGSRGLFKLQGTWLLSLKKQETGNVAGLLFFPLFFLKWIYQTHLPAALIQNTHHVHGALGRDLCPFLAARPDFLRYVGKLPDIEL